MNSFDIADRLTEAFAEIQPLLDELTKDIHLERSFGIQLENYYGDHTDEVGSLVAEFRTNRKQKFLRIIDSQVTICNADYSAMQVFDLKDPKFFEKWNEGIKKYKKVCD